MPEKTLLSWSSGKDSAWALHCLKNDPEIELVGLFTVLNREFDRVTMHATPHDLVEMQARAAGLPLDIVYIPNPCPMEAYSAAMADFLERCHEREIKNIAFGDLYLEDIREYRETSMKDTGIQPIFPLWQKPTDALADEMIDAGLEAWISSVDLKKLPADMVGKKWTKEILGAFPDGCDRCGENGEIHTVVVGGPMFSETIPTRVGEIVERDGFCYADIIPLAREEG